MKRCPHCNARLPAHGKFCPECGAAIVSDQNSADVQKTVLPKRVSAAILVTLLFVIVIAAVFLSRSSTDASSQAPATEPIQTEAIEPTLPFSDDPAAIASASQSVVKLNCYDKNGVLYSSGSGFACFSDNVLVTNYHVVAEDVYRIEVSSEDGRTFDVDYVLATDEARDIAILSTATPHGFPLLNPGDCDFMQKGEKVVAIGSPLGLLNSVSTGVFSGYVAEDSMDVLQFTASISSGSSGGALFDNAGRVLGITYASYESGQNINLAVPISIVAEVYKNRDTSNILTVAQFYDTFQRTYSVDYVIEHAQEFNGQEVTVEGYVSYVYSYMDEGEARQFAGLVSNTNDILGATFRENDASYYWSNISSTLIESTNQKFDGISIEVRPDYEMDMQKFHDTYKLGEFITCTGTLHIYAAGDISWHELSVP